VALVEQKMLLYEKMVGKQGFEPWTSTASGWRSPPELLACK
jgi:hypothetical protein